MNLCPRCQRPLPTQDAEVPVGKPVYCLHCDAMLVRTSGEWVVMEPTPEPSDTDFDAQG